MLTKEQKAEQVQSLRETFAKAQALLAFDYRGLTVSESNDLREKLRQGDGEMHYRIAKNTLIKIAAAETPAEPLSAFCAGPTALGVTFDEPTVLAKVLVDYAKTNEKLELRGGVVDGEAIDADGIVALSKLPTKHELRGMLAGTIQAPLRNLAGTMNALLGNLRNALDQRFEQLNQS